MILESCVVWSILAVTFVLLVCIYLCSPGVEKYKHKIDIKNLKDIIDRMDTGDLIFLCGKTYYEKAIRWVTGCRVSHVGMVVRLPGNTNDSVMLWEADVGQGEKKGPRLIPLVNKIKKYKGERVGAWIKLHAAQPLYKDDILNIIKLHKNKGMQDKSYTWLLSNFPESRIYNMVKDEDKISCSELIADTYQRLAIMTGEHVPSYYTPRHFLKREIHLQPGVKMDKPVYFKF